MAEQVPDWDARLRAAGLRSTAQRRAVLQAIAELRHASVDELAGHLQGTGCDINLSTVYRTLEVLDEVGLVTHAHLSHGGPTYHSVEEDPHIHLVCQRCGHVDQLPVDLALAMADEVRERNGFHVDLTHLALHGRCAGCVGTTGSDPALDGA